MAVIKIFLFSSMSIFAVFLASALIDSAVQGATFWQATYAGVIIGAGLGTIITILWLAIFGPPIIKDKE